jgi:branched-chain amino acid transport system substrate-binding protein
MINDDQGGVNGRKIKFISLDSGSDTGKAWRWRTNSWNRIRFCDRGHLGHARQHGHPPLHEREEGAPALRRGHRIGIRRSVAFPMDHGVSGQQAHRRSGLCKVHPANKPGAKVAILYARDPSGQEWLQGIRDGFGEKAPAMIVKEASFEYSDPAALDAQIVALKDSGADVFMNLAVGRLATRAIRKAYDIDWHPLQFIPNASLSVAAFLEPAGLKKAAGIITNARSKSWLKPQSRQDPAVRAFLEWMKNTIRTQAFGMPTMCMAMKSRRRWWKC